MKRNYFLLSMTVAAIVLAAIVSACAATPPAEQGPTQPALPRLQIIDYQGAALGSPIPDWVQWAVDGNKEALVTMPRFSGKVPFVAWANGQNLDLVRSWANNFQAQAELSRTISNYVEAEFAGTLTGSKDSEESRNYLKEIAASITTVQFSGFMREMDYWTKVRTAPDSRGNTADEYRYYVVYSISQDDLSYQIAQAMGRVAAETQEQQELKDDVEDAIRRVRFNNIQQAAN